MLFFFVFLWLPHSHQQADGSMVTSVLASHPTQGGKYYTLLILPEFHSAAVFLFSIVF